VVELGGVLTSLWLQRRAVSSNFHLSFPFWLYSQWKNFGLSLNLDLPHPTPIPIEKTHPVENDLRQSRISKIQEKCFAIIVLNGNKFSLWRKKVVYFLPNPFSKQNKTQSKISSISIYCKVLRNWKIFENGVTKSVVRKIPNFPFFSCLNR